jgi:hypothetical protein
MVASIKRPTEAWHSRNLFETGMGYVVVARFKGNGDAEIGVFLLDMYCLGVKNAFFTQLYAEEYDRDFLAEIYERDGRNAISPPCARKLVEDAVAYARGLGFEPHPDYRKGARVLGGIDASACPQQFPFGHDGKPLYIQGPDDSPAMVERVMGSLMRRCGEGGFDYVLAMGQPGPSGEDSPEDTDPADPSSPTGRR